MKRCPECRRDYYDETLLYCLDDGNALLEGPGSVDEPATAVFGVPPSGGIPDNQATRVLAKETADENTLSEGREPGFGRPPKGGTQDPSGGGSSSAPRQAKSFDKRLLAAPLLLVIALGGFFGYRYFSSASSKQIESIAVLPFINESGNSDLEYLSDGMTDTLINNLSRIPRLSVKARSTVFKYKGKDVEPGQVAADLNVHAVINGRVMQRGDSLTLNLELVDARSGDQIWGEQYVRKVGDLVTLQSDIARDVSSTLRRKLSGEDSDPVVRNTENPEAFREYLKGRYHWNRRTKEDLDRSIDYFEKAIEIDPTYALAYAGLADSYVVIPSYFNNRAKEAYPKARSAAMKALEIDDSLAQAHAALGCVLHEFDWKFEEAEKEFKRAIELDPNYATAHHWYAELLLTMLRMDEAQREIKLAQESDPLSLIINSIAGLIHGLRGDYAEAVNQLNRTIELDPNFGRAYLFLAGVYERQGKYEEAIVQHEKRAALDGVPAEELSKSMGALREAYRTGGAKGYWQYGAELARKQLEMDPENGPSPFVVGYLFARADDLSRAFEYFERSFEQREPEILRLQDPDLRALRSDPRFQDLLRRIGLPQ